MKLIEVLGITRVSDQDLQIKIDRILRENMSIIVDEENGSTWYVDGQKYEYSQRKSRWSEN